MTAPNELVNRGGSTSELMFSTYRRHLLAKLLLRPEERFHVRELGRMTGFSPGSSRRQPGALSSQ